MDFVANKNFITPEVVSTGMPHQPTRIVKRRFLKGQIIQGEIKTSKGKPSFVLHKGSMIIPLSNVEQVITKKIDISSYDGLKIDESNPKIDVRAVKTTTQKNKEYIDGILLGAIVGVAGVFLAEKEGFIEGADNKIKIYGAIGGALLGCYAVYRFKK